MKNKLNIGVTSLILGALISIFTAMAHISCIYFGPACYKAQMAPPEIVQSAIDGTWLAPIGTLLVSFIFLLCAGYALSAAKLLKKLPFLKLAIYVISFICIIRGVATLPLSIAFPDMVSAFSIAAGVIWLLTGLLFFFGYRHSDTAA
ncbi:hypothetical protein [Pseudoteredinibacter isoporae]|uniref:Vacuolar-type H+-ATPase subunit I/STV1 n=1 Tax=Pseudoteredinibacter isoporae TaxID=570281 RepID=A0A7X0MW36_9GAMM|nr:hypothetical protein [Pseudoteredinibacter isoporae]MBB6521775.1 vacuolar-type H+-ATPase subunit I/STV1 [Pseudoteredinibacter isoporae]NHO87322.1 hypothetical protein [Pseudoteredinibacter isoporae]NIB23046.1 hypothetical protein [Pseudoteredinibacter isoporae]